MKNKLNALLRNTIDDCFQQGILSKTPLPNYVIEVPNNPDHGDFATNLPMTLASSQKLRPREIASVIVDHLKDKGNFIENAEIAGPVFIYFRIKVQQGYRSLS